MNVDENVNLSDYKEQRLVAPFKPPTEQLSHDDQIITEQNHPYMYEFDEEKIIYQPSFVGKTFSTMKQMERNRHYYWPENDFFGSNDHEDENLDPQLRHLYTCVYKCIRRVTLFEGGYEFWNDNITFWRKEKSYNFCVPRYPTYTEVVGSSFLLDSSSTELPISIFHQCADKTDFVAAKICSKELPNMPHIQILEWAPFEWTSSESVIDFSGWTSLRILTVKDIDKLSHFRIILPDGLISLTLDYGGGFSSTPQLVQFEDVFKNITVLQSLKYISLNKVPWSNLPHLDCCTHLFLRKCKNIKSVEAPVCRSFEALSCDSLSGFGLNTLLYNTSLEAIHLARLKKFENFPPGSPLGYKHINIIDTPLASFPHIISPHAYIHILNVGPYFYVGDPQIRKIISFYYDRFLTINEIDRPRKGENVDDMFNRLYGFNWNKFIIKIQRQYRLRKYVKNIHSSISHFLYPDICIYNVAKLLGASQIFGPRDYFFPKPQY